MRPVAFISLPNPFDLLGKLASRWLDLGTESVGNIAESFLGKALGDLNGAVVGALVDMVASVLEFFWDASEPELTASWFSGSQDTPYGQMVLFAMPLLVAFVLAGVIQGVLKGDTAGMLRMVLVRLPGAVLAMSIAVVLADLLIQITDDMSRAVLADFREDIEQVGTVLMTLRMNREATLPAMLLMLIFAFLGLLAAVVLVVQLFVRGSLIYLIAAFSPLVFAASVWEPLRGAVRRLCEIALALILSKLAIAIALAVSSAALVGSWPGDQAREIPTPEQGALQDQSYTQSVGILISSAVMFTVAAFMPWLVYRLVPMVEGALVAQGAGGGPLRAFHSMSATANSIRHNPAADALRAARSAAKRRGQGKKDGNEDGDSGSNPSANPSSRKSPSKRRSPSSRSGTSKERPGVQKSKRSSSPGAAKGSPGSRRPEQAPGRRPPARPGGASGPGGRGRPTAQPSKTPKPKGPGGGV